MLAAFLKVRSSQFLRAFLGLGRFYMLLTFSGILFLLYVVFDLLGDPQKAFYVFLGLLFLVLVFHVNRKDMVFLKGLFSYPSIPVFVEYLIYTSPFWMIFLFTASGYLAPVFLLCLGLISLTNPAIRSLSPRTGLARVFPIQQFEWRAFSRPNAVFLIAWIFLGLVSFFVPYLVLAYNFVFILFCASTYQQCESLEVLQALRIGPRKLLWKKLRFLFLFFLVAVLPLNLGALILLTLNPLLILGSLTITLIYGVYFVLTKYAFYKPNEDLSSQSVTSSLVLLGMIIPIFAILGLVLTIRNLFVASRNLNLLLHDYDQ